MLAGCDDPWVTPLYEVVKAKLGIAGFLYKLERLFGTFGESFCTF